MPHDEEGPDDALNATRAAVQEGIVPGGVALLRSSVKITAKGENDDQEAGVNIVRRALQSPARQIVENAGDEASIVVGKILEKNTDDFGYNAQAGEYGDMTRSRPFAPRSRTQPRLLRCSSPPKP